MEYFAGILIGIAAGLAGGVFGIGGGVLIVPALVLALGFAQHRAQGTSLVALLAPVGLFALVEYRKRGDVNFGIGALIAGGFMVGAYFGARVSVAISEDTMRKAFAIFLGTIAIWMFTKKG